MPGRFRTDLVMTPLPGIVARAFFITAQRIQQMEEPMERAAMVVSKEIAANFDAEGRPGRWEGLKEGTARKKASEGLDPRILRATGALYDGLTGQGMGGLGSWDISQQGADWVANLEDPTGYGWRHLEEHQFMPIRDWTFVSDEGLDEIEETFYEWLHEVTESLEVS